jgi:hypothetical protein
MLSSYYKTPSYPGIAILANSTTVASEGLIGL